MCRNSKDAIAALTKGQKVILAPSGKDILQGGVPSFASIFWNNAWFPGKKHLLGWLFNTEHQALKNFPTQINSDFHHWNLMKRSVPIILDDLDPKIRPIIQPIDDWFKCRRLGVLFEAKAGKGRLMVSSAGFSTEGGDPVARQLWASIAEYMNSDSFDPQVEITPEQISSLIK